MDCTIDGTLDGTVDWYLYMGHSKLTVPPISHFKSMFILSNLNHYFYRDGNRERWDIYYTSYSEKVKNVELKRVKTFVLKCDGWEI